MAEILSIPTSVIGLVQGIAIVRKSLILIFELSGAPAESKRIGRELEQVQTIIQSCQKGIQLEAAHQGSPIKPSRPMIRTSFAPPFNALSIAKTISFETIEEYGQLSLIILDHQLPPPLGQTTDTFVKCRLYVLKNPGCQAGVVVQFCKVSGTQCQFSRSLATFRVHDDNSPVFEHIRNNDVAVIWRMLSVGIVSPNDRDAHGNTLLWVGTIYCLLSCHAAARD